MSVVTSVLVLIVLIVFRFYGVTSNISSDATPANTTFAYGSLTSARSFERMVRESIEHLHTWVGPQLTLGRDSALQVGSAIAISQAEDSYRMEVVISRSATTTVYITDNQEKTQPRWSKHLLRDYRGT